MIRQIKSPNFCNHLKLCAVVHEICFSNWLFFILDPLSGDGVGHWIFDSGELKNIGTGASSLGDGTVIDGTILSVPDRQGMVIQCDGKDDTFHKCFSAPDTGKTCIS